MWHVDWLRDVTRRHGLQLISLGGVSSGRCCFTSGAFPQGVEVFDNLFSGFAVVDRVRGMWRYRGDLLYEVC